MTRDFPALHQIPEALKPWETAKRWVCFKIEQRGNGTTKPPYNPRSGYHASVSDPKTWGTYAEAVAAVSRFNLDGIGIVLGDGLFGVDIDHATDPATGKPRAEAAEIIETMGSYTEISPSGSGFHILASGDFKPTANKKDFPGYSDKYALEMYSTGKYFTVTGQTFRALPVQERAAEANRISRKYLSPQEEKPQQKAAEDPLNDLALLNMARNSKNGARFIALFDHGDITGYPSQSEADLALVNDLCYWANGDPQIIDRLFRRSALFREKWNVIHAKGKTYGQLTIEKALQTFTPYAPKSNAEPQIFQAKPDILKPQEKKPAPALEFYSAADLQNDTTPEPEFIVKDILPPGLTVFAASPKMGKSFLMLSMAAAIAQGLPFWGKETKAGSVLYCDIESNKHRIKKRLQAMGITPPHGLFITHRTQQLDSGLLDQISGFLSSHADTRAVIIDTLGRVKGASRSRTDAYTADSQILGPLQTFALEKGIAIIAVTHMRKSNPYIRDMDPFEAITGSNAQFGVSDAAWLLTGKRNEAEKHFLAAGRDIEENIDWTVERQDNGSWSLRGDSATLEQDKTRLEYDLSPLAEVIRENTKPIWKVTMQEIVEAITQKTGSVPFTAIQAAKEIRKIEDSLLRYDRILHYPPDGNGGRKGRPHTFKRTEI